VRVELLERLSPATRRAVKDEAGLLAAFHAD
jgi:hypothetical protein